MNVRGEGVHDRLVDIQAALLLLVLEECIVRIAHGKAQAVLFFPLHALHQKHPVIVQLQKGDRFLSSVPYPFFLSRFFL